MVARIFRPAKTAMQSGKAKTNKWILQYEPEVARTIDPLMGYTSTSDAKSQIKLVFNSQEEAVSYAKRNKIPFRISQANDRKIFRASYPDNFKFDRRTPWTH